MLEGTVEVQEECGYRKGVVRGSVSYRSGKLKGRESGAVEHNEKGSTWTRIGLVVPGGMQTPIPIWLYIYIYIYC